MANVLPRPCTCAPRDPRKSIREVSPIALHEKWHTERMAKEEDVFYRRGATVGKGLSHFTRASIGYWKWGKALDSENMVYGNLAGSVFPSNNANVMMCPNLLGQHSPR